MLNQLVEIMKFDWDTLIILDSCRYDYFEQEHPRYLKGKLRKAFSPASCTMDWIKAVWSGYYDLTYLSAMPGINSKGVPRRGYVANEHFKRVIDVWEFGWDEELGSVPPWEFNKVIGSVSGRRVLHYMQPHQPYIGETKLTYFRPKPDGKSRTKYRTSEKIMNAVRNGEFTVDYMRKAYRDNLRLALEWIARLPIEGRTIISADHGEFLGERTWGVFKRFWHPCGSRNPVVRKIPWFEVEK